MNLFTKADPAIRVTAIICILLGGAFLLLGIFFLGQSIILSMKGVVTTGIMIDKKFNLNIETNNNDSDEIATCYPVIEFVNTQNDTVKFVCKSTIPLEEYQEGAEIEVIYNPSNPADSAELNTFSGIWSGVIILFIFGSSILGIAYAILKWLGKIFTI